MSIGDLFRKIGDDLTAKHPDPAQHAPPVALTLPVQTDAAATSLTPMTVGRDGTGPHKA